MRQRHRRRAVMGAASLLGTLLIAGLGQTQAQIRPRFMIAFDTSGSMGVDLQDTPTFGDGVAGPTLGMDTDCDGVANDSRLFVAKEALRNMILSFGDLEFALARFPMLTRADVLCNNTSIFGPAILSINENECETSSGPFISSMGDPTLNIGPVVNTTNCGAPNWDDNPVTLETPASTFPAACRPGTGAFPAIRRWAIGSPTVCLNYAGGCPSRSVMVDGAIFRWPAGDVLVGFPGFGWPAGQENRTGILRWIDNRETAFDTSSTTGNFCNHATTGDCELRAQGGTPLGGVLRAARDYMVPIRAADPVGACRPYVVLLLTDGVESCESNPLALNHPINVATGLFTTSNIRTYVLGLAINPEVRVLLNNIATAGGTDAGSPGGDTAFFADDPDTLSAGLSEIVRDSLLVERCNGVDDNCNALIDEGFVKYCNLPAGITGSTLCTNPGETRCDGRDDNCDGRIDEGLVNACGGCGTTPLEICDGLDNDCDGFIDDGVCAGCIPELEVCDGIDNDCDGLTDEGVTRPCGTDTGECTAGTESCALGRFVGCTGIAPQPELCDGLDNDCDGVVDGFNEPCGPDVGACVAGSRLCTSGTFGPCVGALGPSSEVCNGLDDDCDGETDEGNPGGGAECGGGTCGIGVLTCIMGRLVCEGGGEPVPEICDGRDNDCDGETDEDVPSRGPCGPDVGSCLPGREICRGGTFVCEGGLGPNDEICNGRDDDCDGDTDEGLDGMPCGSDVGECAPGVIRCTDGFMVCSGEIPPRAEICDCEDNDCDGETDEPAPGSSLCPEGSECLGCQCALPCADSEFPCPVGRACQEFPEGRFCIGALCDDASCATMTVERDGDVVCSPAGPQCTCRGNDCAAPCDGVVCLEGSICRPSDGRCVENNCRDLGCPDDLLCYRGQCQPDRCASMSCPEACRDGTCVESCAGIACGAAARCVEGRCVPTGCGECLLEGTVCHTERGECLRDPCPAQPCNATPGTVCDPSSGDCIEDECIVVFCPAGQTCVLGSCFGSPVRRERILATGGGGAVCSVSAPGRGSGGLVAWLLGAAALAWLVRSRRARRQSRARRCRRSVAPAVDSGSPAAFAALLVLALSAALSLGCKVDPYCINCADTGIGTGRDSGEGGRPDGDTDGEAPDGCAEGAREACNGRDDDCDGRVDEDFDLDIDVRNCGECGNACAPPNAFPSCEAGECRLARCDVGYSNLDGDLDNGCEYRCLPVADEDTTCDGLDDDCDGEIDEEADLTTDPRNCGACGNSCRFERASALCMAGECALGLCVSGYLDLDGDPDNGCEYRCTPSGDEMCNGLDDDCDGMIDEGNPGGGADCGGTVGACRPGVRMCDRGSLVCMGGVEPTIEICNTADDDCNGTVDDGFSLMTDVRNCGRCGVSCERPGTVVRCNAGTCETLRCAAGFVDRDGNPANGCEFVCDLLGGEVCNGVDDDCDGMTDEGLTPPSNYCNANGPCAGTVATCDGALGWRCHYPAGVETSDPDGTVIGPETRCDGIDGNCNGAIDDPFPTVGTECANGVGACRRTGVYACNAAGDNVVCTAPAAGAPTPETCNDLDDDCDGMVDDPDRDGDGVIEDDELRGFGMARITVGARIFYIMRWEASRPDATATAAGTTMSRACSRPNVQPWTTVTYTEATNACCALNASGTCSGTRGWRLCSAADWQSACEGGAGCEWAYASLCSSSQPTVCNGAEFDAYPSPPECVGPGNQDCVTTTGSPLFPMCSVSWDGDAVFDMSGNVKEWTSTARGGGTHEIRGGSFNNLEGGRTCDFDFTVAADSFAFPNTGFRCCFIP